MRSLLKDTGLPSLVVVGSLALLVACGGDEKKPAATAVTPVDETARAAGAHASGEMPAPVVTVTPPPTPPPQSAPIVVQEDLRARCELPDEREEGLPFAYDVADLDESDKEMLAALATCLGQGGLGGQSIRIVGHADPRGSDQYNMDLGMRRAVAVRQYLFEKGVPAGSVVVTSEGEGEASGEDEEGWALDRRVEIEIATPQGTTEGEGAAEETPTQTPEQIPPGTPTAPDNPY